MAGVDWGVFDRPKTLIDYQQLNAAFEAKKQEAAATQALGLIKLANGGVDKPSAVAEYEYFKQLPDQASQQQYLAVKRAAQIQNLGNQFGAFNPLTGQTAAIPGSQIAVSPDAMPELKGQQAFASAAGSNAADLVSKPQIAAATTAATEGAKNTAEANKIVQEKGRQAVNSLDLIAEARQLLPNATGGGWDNVGKSIKGAVGYSDAKTQADARLGVIASGLTSAVPRMQGPQSDRDVQLYQQAAGDVANTSKPVGDRLAALKTIEGLQLKYKDQAAITASPQAAAPNGSFSHLWGN